MHAALLAGIRLEDSFPPRLAKTCGKTLMQVQGLPIEAGLRPWQAGFFCRRRSSVLQSGILCFGVRLPVPDWWAWSDRAHQSGMAPFIAGRNRTSSGNGSVVRYAFRAGFAPWQSGRRPNLKDLYYSRPSKMITALTIGIFWQMKKIGFTMLINEKEEPQKPANRRHRICIYTKRIEYVDFEEQFSIEM